MNDTQTRHYNISSTAISADSEKMRSTARLICGAKPTPLGGHDLSVHFTCDRQVNVAVVPLPLAIGYAQEPTRIRLG